MKDGWNGQVGILAQKVHGCDFRFCFDPGHKSASNPGDEFKSIDEGDEISLDGRQRRNSGARTWVYLMKRSCDNDEERERGNVLR